MASLLHTIEIVRTSLSSLWNKIKEAVISAYDRIDSLGTRQSFSTVLTQESMLEGCETILRNDKAQWNRLRREYPSWAPSLRGLDLSGVDLSGLNLSNVDLCMACLRGANLSSANLVHANLQLANLSEADLTNADLTFADLNGATIVGARLEDHVLTGWSSPLGEILGYQVIMFSTTGGHVLRARCWTGTLTTIIARALEEDKQPLTQMEAGSVVSHGVALLKAWNQVDGL